MYEETVQSARCDDTRNRSRYRSSVRASSLRFALVAAVIASSYAGVILWTWWLNMKSAEPAMRIPLEIFAGSMLVVVAGVVVSAWLSHRDAVHPATGGTRRRWCKRVTGMLIGPLATILMLSGLYATFRFDDERALPAGVLLLMTSAGGFAAYMTCEWQERRDQSRRSA